MPTTYIIWFVDFADMVHHMKRWPPAKIAALGSDGPGRRCFYVGLARQNGARYR